MLPEQIRNPQDWVLSRFRIGLTKSLEFPLKPGKRTRILNALINVFGLINLVGRSASVLYEHQITL